MLIDLIFLVTKQFLKDGIFFYHCYFEPIPHFLLVHASLFLFFLRLILPRLFSRFMNCFHYVQVVLNKKKEFQWQRLALFLRAGATRYAGQWTIQILQRDLITSAKNIYFRRLYALAILLSSRKLEGDKF